MFGGDILFVKIEQTTGWTIPSGVTGVALGFPAFLLSSRSQNQMLLLCALGAFCSLFFLQAGLSGYAYPSDYIMWIKNAGLLLVGFSFYQALSKSEYKKNYIFFTANMICALVIIFWIGSWTFGNYLRFSDGFAVLALVNLAFAKTVLNYSASFAGGLFGLLSLCSRFSFFSFCMIGLLGSLQFCFGSKRYRNLLAFFGVFLVPLLFLSTSISTGTNERITRLINQPQTDNSFQQRKHLNRECIHMIAQNPIHGQFAYYRQRGRIAEYGHTGLSFWAEFGLPGLFFLLFSLGLILASLKKFFRNWKSKSAPNHFLASVQVYALLGLLLAKSYHWSVLYFVLGATVASVYREQNQAESHDASPA